MSISSHDMVWGSLIHLGRNGWGESASADHVRFDENLWFLLPDEDGTYPLKEGDIISSTTNRLRNDLEVEFKQ